MKLDPTVTRQPNAPPSHRYSATQHGHTAYGATANQAVEEWHRTAPKRASSMSESLSHTGPSNVSIHLCNEDFTDPVSGLVFKAGTYSRSFRDLCLRTRHTPIAERQAMFRARHRRGPNGGTAATRSVARNQRESVVNDRGFADYLRLSQGIGPKESGDETEPAAVQYHFGPY